MLNKGESDRAIVEEFYLAALGRLPTEPALQALLSRTGRDVNRRAALEDFVWALS